MMKNIKKAISLIQDAINRRQYHDVENLAKDYEKLYPNHPYFLKVLGISLLVQKKWIESRKPLNEAIQIAPNDPELYCNLGVSYRMMGEYEEAINQFKKTISLKPNYELALLNLTNSLFHVGKYEEALDCSKKILVHNRHNVSALFNLGLAYEKLNKLDQAKIYFTKVIELSPKYFAAFSNLAMISVRKKQYDDALNYSKNALLTEGCDAIIFCNHGVVLEKLGLLEEAEKYFLRAIECDAKYYQAYNNLGKLQIERGRFREAYKNLQIAQSLDPLSAEYSLNLGFLNIYFGDINGALSAFKDVIQSKSQNYSFDALVYEAVLHFIKLDFKSSLKNLKRANEYVDKLTSDHKNTIAYKKYLENLIENKNKSLSDNFSEKRVIHVVGDSHTLGFHGEILDIKSEKMICNARWILGCKQWFLGNDNYNKYKYRFESILEDIPSPSIIVLSIGEIDCRLNEGILTAWKKHGDVSLIEFSKNTVDSYMKYLNGVFKNTSHTLVVVGIPAPNNSFNEVDGKVKQEFIDFINLYNALLKEQSAKNNYLFLDIYAATVNLGGVASGRIHLDEYHLQPNFLGKELEKLLNN